MGGYIAGRQHLQGLPDPALPDVALLDVAAAGRRGRLHRRDRRARAASPSASSGCGTTRASSRPACSELGFDTGISETPITPVMAGDEAKAQQLAARLFERGVFATSVVFPTVALGKARVRTIVTSEHTRDELQTCLDAFAHGRPRAAADLSAPSATRSAGSASTSARRSSTRRASGASGRTCWASAADLHGRVRRRASRAAASTSDVFDDRRPARLARASAAAFEAAYGGFQDERPLSRRAARARRRCATPATAWRSSPTSRAERTAELRALGVDAEVMAMSDELGVAQARRPSSSRSALELMGDPTRPTWPTSAIGSTTTSGPPPRPGMRAVWLRRGPWALLVHADRRRQATLVVDSLDELVERIERLVGRVKLTVVGCAPAYTRRPGQRVVVLPGRARRRRRSCSISARARSPSCGATVARRRSTPSSISHLHADHNVDLVPLRHWVRTRTSGYGPALYRARPSCASRFDALPADADFLSRLRRRARSAPGPVRGRRPDDRGAAA